MEHALVHPGTSLCPSLPSLRGMDVGTPEWPCPALSRAVAVHGAPLGFVKKNAVLVLLLDEADNPVPHAPRIAVPKLGLREMETAGDGADLIIGDTNGAGKAATAAPAAQAPKAKPVFVPEIITHEMAHQTHMAEDMIRLIATA